MTAYLAPQFDTQFFDGSNVAAGYKLYTYDSGTTTPKAVYSDQAGTVPHTNPIVLDVNGRVTGQMWLGSGEYTFTLKTSADVMVKTWNDVAGSGTANEAAAYDAAIRADLASTSDASKGAGMVAQNFTLNYAVGTVGSAVNSLHKKSLQTINIQDLGALDDWNGTTGTNSFTALETLCALAPIRIRIPKTLTGTGVYLYSGTSAITDAAGVVLDIDEGVKFYVQGNSIPPFIKQGVRATRPLLSNWVGGPAGTYSRYLGSHLFDQPADHTTFLTRSQCALHTPIILDGTTDFAHLTMSGAWPNGSLVAAAPGGTIASNQIAWTALPAANFSMSVTQVVPGDELHAQLSPGSYLPAIAIETDTGWALIRQDQTSLAAASSLVVTERTSGTTTEYSTLVSSAGFASYQMQKAVVGVKILGPRTFALMLNHVVFKRVTLGANILSAGWAGGFATSGGFSILHMTAMRRKANGGLRNLRIVCMGDSTGDRVVTQMSQYEWMRHYLAGLGGTQVTTFTNLSQSGATSANQLTALQATDVSNYDYGLIQIGINDIQTGVPATTFVSNIASMVSYLRASHVEPIVGIPAQFYSATEANAYGQNGGVTSNSSAGAGHRVLLLEQLALLGVPVNVMIEEDMGAVNPSLLALDSTVVDPMVYDNIHPSTFGCMVAGYSWAKAVGAHALGAADQSVRSVAIPARWFAVGIGATNRGNFSCTDAGAMSAAFKITRDGVSITNGMVIALLPLRLRPQSEVVIPVWSIDSTEAPLQSSYLTIGSDGSVKAYNVSATAYYIAGTATWQI